MACWPVGVEPVGSHVELELEARLTFDNRADQRRLLAGSQRCHAPLGQVAGQHPLLVDGQQRTARPVADPREPLPDNCSRLDPAGEDLDVVGQSGGVDRHVDVRQGNPEDVGGGIKRLAVGHVELLDDRGIDTDVFWWPAHAHEVNEHRPTVDGRDVGGFVEVDSVDRLAQSRQRCDESLEHKTGILACGVKP